MRPRCSGAEVNRDGFQPRSNWRKDRVTNASEAVFEKRFAASPSALRDIRAAVQSFTSECGARTPCANDIVLAVDEACQNIIRHAYSGEMGEIVLQMQCSDGVLVISLIDFAPAVDKDKVRGRDLDDVKPGGLGTHFIHEVMDRVEFVDAPPDCGNMLRMVKRIE
jgi:sigma-B regulation protein RsbU (phosphoserine phosphatase)